MNTERINKTVEQLKEHKGQIKEILKSNGYDSAYNSFEDLINALNNMYILNPKNTHKIAILSEEGYVIAIRDFTTKEIYNGEIPEDLNLNYYKLEDGKLVLDEKLKEHTLSLD